MARSAHPARAMHFSTVGRRDSDSDDEDDNPSGSANDNGNDGLVWSSNSFDMAWPVCSNLTLAWQGGKAPFSLFGAEHYAPGGVDDDDDADRNFKVADGLLVNTYTWTSKSFLSLL